MHGIKPRTLSNEELLKYSAMLLDCNQPLPADWAIELVRRLNYYVGDGSLNNATASSRDDKQIALPL